MPLPRSVPRSRLGRLGQLGRLAGGLAAGALNEGTRQLLQGQRPSPSDMFLTSANAQRLSERLSEMRGAAMKIGQLLSMDSGQLLPEPLSEALARLRDDAHPMPLGEVAEVLNRAWGRGWEQQFRRFCFTPFAAASIGQVHKAELKNGRTLAIKIQYPGIRESIDSDVDNVGHLLRLFRQIPPTLDFAPLLQEAKRLLHLEADYRHEADLLVRYADWIQDDNRFAVPRVFTALTTEQVLAMSYLEGEPIETLAGRPAVERHRTAVDLLKLSLRELFEWGLVQTDPNFSNYRFAAASGQIQLLDFGAVREYRPEQQETLRELVKACLEGDKIRMAELAVSVGYLVAGDPAEYRDQVVGLLSLVSEPLRQPSYDFSNTDLVSRMSGILVDMRLRGRHGRLPPPDILFLHRKLGGLYLLLAKLRARLRVGEIVGSLLV
jgi:predicted unusual protein kinase regulating ubiquinone biosynthesis (AarF/ABC1/UbiB family)